MKQKLDGTRSQFDQSEGKMEWPGNIPGLSRPPALDKIEQRHSKNAYSLGISVRSTSTKRQEFNDVMVQQEQISSEQNIKQAIRSTKRSNRFNSNADQAYDEYSQMKHLPSNWKHSGAEQGQWNDKTRLRDSTESQAMLVPNKYGVSPAIISGASNSINLASSTPQIPKANNVKLQGIDQTSLRNNLFTTLDSRVQPLNQKEPKREPGVSRTLHAKTQSTGAAKPIWEGYIDTKPQVTIEQILEKVKNRHKSKDKSPIPAETRDSPSVLMKGKSKYLLPTKEALRDNIKGRVRQDKNNKIRDLSNNSDTMVGTILQRDFFEKTKRAASLQRDPMEDYVKHFSDAADIINQTSAGSKGGVNKMIGFAGGIKFKMQKVVAVDNTTNAIADMMKNFKKQRVQKEEIDEVSEKEEEFLLDKKNTVFNKSLEEETKTIHNIAQDLLRKVKYQKIFKSSDLNSATTPFKNRGALQHSDPRIKYFQQCYQGECSALPILDKIYKKTICLQDYTMSEGHCKSLAHACEFFDAKVVNRILMSNCGVNGDQFAMILQGLAKLNDFKSIIYKMNGLNPNAIRHMEPLLQKRIPHHLDELKIIDCKVSGSLIEHLMASIRKQSQLKKLYLVNILHTDGSYLSVVEYLKESTHLQELDVSWSTVRPATVKKLVEALKDNRQLTCLTLSFNKLLARQNSQELTEQEKANGILEIPLRDENVETMDCFLDFIKYNPNLIHLDLQSTQLYEPALRFIGRMLTRAQSLRTLHLCNNPGLSHKMFEWLRTRIRAQPYIEPIHIKPYNKATQETQKKTKKAASLQVSLFSKLGNAKKKEEGDTDETKWKKIRQGLRLRNIVSSKRMNDLNQTSLIRPALFCDDEPVVSNDNVINDGQKLIVARHLGYQAMQPGAAQWRLITDAREECWHCDQHILTLFIWTPRIGQLAGSKDQNMIKYYKDKIDAELEADFIPEIKLRPQIASQFTDWRYKEMRNVVEFCAEFDPHKPNFMQSLIDDGIIRRECAPPDNKTLSLQEEKLLKSQVMDYYKDNWSSVILVIMRYKNPLIANVNQMTSLSEAMDNDQEIFFHIDWLKPGRHVYAIEYTIGDVAEDDEQAKQIKASEAMQDKIRMQKGFGKKSKDEFYIHEMLATFRTEDVPMYCKQRKVREEVRDFYKPKPVFQNFVRDSPDILATCLQNDMKLTNFGQICEGRQSEEKIVTKQLAINYQLVKDMFTLLQSRSRTYPFVDTFTFRQYFVREIGVMEDDYYKVSNFDILLSEVMTDNAQLQSSGVRIPAGSFCRYQFLELCVKMGKFLYSTGYMFRKGGRQHTNKYAENEENYSEASIDRAFFIFLEDVLKPYYLRIKRQFSEFRENQLWDVSVEVLYTMNEKALLGLYNHYAKQNLGSNGKAFNADYMTVHECIQLFKHESPMGLTKKMIRQAFALCKMTVVNEIDRKASDKYLAVTFVEFLELVARIADLYFRDSEMEEEFLAVKVGYVLDELLPLVNSTRVEQKTVIEEFSDSDNEY